MATAIGDLVVRLNAQSAPFERSMQRAQSALGRFSSVVTSGIGRMASLAAGAVAAHKAFSTLSFGVNLAAQAEQAEIAFGVLLGSAKEAQMVLRDVNRFAEQTPFELPELVDASRKLLAFGVSTKKLLPSLKAIGDVSSGIGAPISEIAELYGKARVQGRLFGEDINQLTGRGIPIIQELSRQFGVADSEVKKLVENGKVNFGHLEIAFQSLSGEGGKFAGMMGKQSETLLGRWSTFSDTFNGILREVGATLIETFNFKGILDNMIAFGETVKQNVQTMGFLFRNFATLAEMKIIDLVQSALAILPQMEQPILRLGAIFVGTWEGVGAFFSAWLENVKGGFLELQQFAVAIGQGIQAAFAALRAGEFRSIGSAFADAFIGTLARQQHVQAKNAFAEFGSAFTSGQARVMASMTKAGGISGALEARKRNLALGLVAAEFQRFTAVTPKDGGKGPAADAIAEAEAATAKSREQKSAGAMEMGSREAWSTIVSAWRGSQDKVTKGEKEISKRLDGVKRAIETKEETVIEVPV